MKENIDNIIEIRMPNHLSFKNNKDNLMIIISDTNLNIVFNRGMGFHMTGTAGPINMGLREKTISDAVIAKLVIKDNIIVLDFYNKENLVNSTCCYALIKEQYDNAKLTNNSKVGIRYIDSKCEPKMLRDDNYSRFNFGITPKRKYRKLKN